MSGIKNPVLVEAGKRGARKRWGPPRILDMRDCEPRFREVVQSLLDGHREAVELVRSEREAVADAA